ncbi:hypothetical protein, partial [Haemophilus haemolyticus]|uniref:hypothetical protein n=1 Tax=Haemophilus haemolyticus TaxID=726 RepID=UPI0015E440DF
EINLINDINNKIKANKNNEHLANEMWEIKTIFLAQNFYLIFIESLYKKQYYYAWCTLEKCELKINELDRHASEKIKNNYYFHFLKFQVKRWQAIYPYKLFTSPEFIYKKVRCSICNEIISPRGNCKHIIGELYSGEICYCTVEEIELIGIAIVKNPVMKSNVIDPEGKNKNFSGLNMILNTLNTCLLYTSPSPRDPKTSKKFITESPDSLCPCGSGLSYLMCCQRKNGCLIPHMQIILYNQDIKNKLDTHLSIELKISDYLYQKKYS